MYVEKGYYGVSRSQGVPFVVCGYVGKNKDGRDTYTVLFPETGHTKTCEDRMILKNACIDDDLYEGKRFVNSCGDVYTVLGIDFSGSKPTRRRHYVKFDGYEEVLSRMDQDIVAGKCKNPYKISLHGVARIGEYDYHLPYSKQAKSTWDSMLKRCYSTKQDGYERYGGSGVFVCDRWLTFSNFVADIPNIRGWDIDKFCNKELALDKDKFSDGVKRYAPEVCCFLSLSENAKLSSVKYLVETDDGDAFICTGGDLPSFSEMCIDTTLDRLRENNYVYRFKSCTIRRI